MTNPQREQLFRTAITTCGGALARMARGWEANDARREELLQEMHLALWQSLARFSHQCSLRTWVFRVANNVGASHALKERRGGPLVDLETLEPAAAEALTETLERRDALDRLLRLAHRLAPIDRQLLLLYLEGEDAKAISDVSGLSAANVATRIHRLKQLLTRHFEGARHE